MTNEPISIPGFVYDVANDTWIDRDGKRYHWSFEHRKLVPLPPLVNESLCAPAFDNDGRPTGNSSHSPRPTNTGGADPTVEELIQAKGLTAPRVTPKQIEDVIAGEYYFTALDGVVSGAGSQQVIEQRIPLADHQRQLGLLTLCVLVLQNGFVVTGESACASPENFNAEVGRKAARNHAVAKIWPLEGYRLRQQLHEKEDFKNFKEQFNIDKG